MHTPHSNKMSTTTTSQHSSVTRHANKMSVTQTYLLAHTARAKLSSEASHEDHDLRRLVGHANLLDTLMLDLTEAKQEHEAWLNQAVRQASKPTEQRHIQWADSATEDPEEDSRAADTGSPNPSVTDSDYSSDEDAKEEIKEAISSLRPASTSNEVEVVDDDGEEHYDDLALHLTQSHSTPPPGLEHDAGDSSDDDSLPPSPPAEAPPSFSEKRRQQIAAAGFSPGLSASEQQDGYDAGNFMPQWVAPGLISAISVY
jgi:hypothetical protein